MGDLALVDSKDRLGFAELVYGTIFSPAVTFARVSRENHLFNGFIIFLTVTLLSYVVNFLNARNYYDLLPRLSEPIIAVIPYLGILATVSTFLFWFIQAGILQVFAELLGGKGNALQILTVLALAGIPKVFAVPFQVLGAFLPGPVATIVPAIVVILLGWSVALIVIGLREVHGISMGRAVAVLVIPIGVLSLVFLIIAVSMVGFLIPLINNV
ncbi:YIP1 family protein [Phosphitispora sp. TUW77]|uniref:YIP1 family protein n=1 Tax=Phosphitispora sp. TUW77 TaxID=3152361 RepID=UPI003AB8D22A